MKKENNILGNYSNVCTLSEKISILGQKYLNSFITDSGQGMENSEYAGLKTKLSSMKQAGLTKTKNYITLSEKLQRAETYEKERAERKTALESLSLLCSNMPLVHTGLGIICIKEEDFATLVEEYGFDIDIIDEFAGTLSDEEIEICIDLYNNTVENTICDIPDLYLGSPIKDSWLVRINRVNQGLREKLFCTKTNNKELSKDDIISTPLFENDSLLNTTYYPVFPAGGKLLIAFNEKEHILFHVTNYGVVVFTKEGGIDYGTI